MKKEKDLDEIDRNIPRWITVTKELVNSIDNIEYIIPGHGELVDKKALKLTYDYYSEMQSELIKQKEMD